MVCVTSSSQIGSCRSYCDIIKVFGKLGQCQYSPNSIYVYLCLFPEVLAFIVCFLQLLWTEKLLFIKELKECIGITFTLMFSFESYGGVILESFK